MGYKTQYSLKYRFLAHRERFEKVFLDEIEEKYECAYEALMGDEEPMKWYSHERELKKLSEKYPMVVLTLEGYGEEKYDMWVKYFCAGKIQVEEAVISFGEFSPDKLE